MSHCLYVYLDMMKYVIHVLQFSPGPLWRPALVPGENHIQRPMFHDPCDQGYLSLAPLRLCQSQVWVLKFVEVSVCDVYIIPSYCHFSNISTETMLYTEKDIESSMDKIETVNFHQV